MQIQLLRWNQHQIQWKIGLEILIQNKYHHKLSKVRFFTGSSNLGFKILKTENRVKKS